MAEDTPTTDEVHGAWLAARCTNDGQMPYGELPTTSPGIVTLSIPGDPKTIREALCVAQHAVNQHIAPQNLHYAPDVVAALIRELDRHRPLGPDGKHGNRHTPTCGCDDNPLTEQEPTS